MCFPAHVTLMSHTLAHTHASQLDCHTTRHNTKKHTTRTGADGHRVAAQTVAQWRRFGYGSATDRLRRGCGSARAAPQQRGGGSAGWQRCEKLMRSAATVGDGGDYGNDGEATTLIGRKMSPIAPSACHARTYTIWSLCTALCDELLCDELLHR